MKIIYTKSKSELQAEREANRRRRGDYEMERMLARYEEECSECVVIKPAKHRDDIQLSK